MAPETEKRRARARRDDQRDNAQRKFRDALNGEAIDIWSQLQIQRVKPEEWLQLWHESQIRLYRLSPDARERLMRNWWIMLLGLPRSDRGHRRRCGTP
jgi:hypothetical protein